MAAADAGREPPQPSVPDLGAVRGPGAELVLRRVLRARRRAFRRPCQARHQAGRICADRSRQLLEATPAWFACVELGAIAVTTNTRSAAAEMEYFAGHCGAVAAITQPAYAELISANCRGLRWIAVISHDAGSAPAQSVPRGDSFELLFADSADRPRRLADPFAPCSVQYTSGTTSRPKAVLWTHANALWGAKINAAHEDLHSDDVHQTYLPLFHTNARPGEALRARGARAGAADRKGARRDRAAASRRTNELRHLVDIVIRAQPVGSADVVTIGPFTLRFAS